jgi:hypothetical protein
VSERKSVNFTIVPADDDSIPRIYSNFCAIQNSPFDFTLTFCDMQPLGEKQLREAEQTQVVRAPVRVRLAIPVGAAGELRKVPGGVRTAEGSLALTRTLGVRPIGPGLAMPRRIVGS